MAELKLYNTLTRKKEIFEPLHPGFVGIYVCGPTVYGHSHIGHAKSYVSFDVIVRYFRYLGYRVRYVQNITDVGHLVSDADEGEDKIAKQARLEQLEPMEVAERYTRSYFEDMDILNVQRPDISPRASGHIPEQIELVEELLKKGFAYEKNGNVYFDVAKDKEYGKLSGRNIQELLEGQRIDVNEEKKNPVDFALWKKADPQHIMQWNSPWGRGYPGWHAECSVMSSKYLGQPFDIHGGGLENVFPHHECEIAQSEAAHDKPFARYWLHNNMVTIDGTKMGKSLGNTLSVKEAVKKYHPLAVRFFILSSHYRSPLDFSDRALEAAQKGLEKIHHAMLRLLGAKTQPGADKDMQARTEKFVQDFRNEMNDDFNTPKAIAVIFDFFRDLNSRLDKQKAAAETLPEIIKALEETAGSVLGLLPADYDELGGKSDASLDAVIQILIDIRNKARKEKNFALADEIRAKLAKAGIELQDTPQGTEWGMRND